MHTVFACVFLGVSILTAPAFADIHTQLSPTDLTIPDDGPEVTAVMAVPLDRYISDISVFVELATPVASHMRVEVTSAWDTRVRLMHQASGGETDGYSSGWYPGTFTPYEDMTQWHGEGGGGIWIIHCQDIVGGGGNSTLISWGVQITYDEAAGNAATTWSGVKALFE